MLPKFFQSGLFACLLLAVAAPAFAQTSVAFGTIRQNTDDPVEVTSDTLSVDQDSGVAIFTGDVVVGQGDMRLSAPRVLVVYKEDQSGIERLEATGGATLVSGPDAAEAERADYDIETGLIVMTGDALMTQGNSAITADRMDINLENGTAEMKGRVKTILQTSND